MSELKIKLPEDAATKEYHKRLLDDIEKELAIATRAKQTGFDASLEVESKPVTDLAERAETLVGPVGIAQRYREVLLEHKGDRMETLFQIFREIIEQQWIEIPDDQKRVEQAIKTGLVLVTEGVVVSPLDGLPKVLISVNPDGSKYIDIYYAGPIRAAGGSATVVPLILGDYAKQLMGLDRYMPTEDEVERYVEEIMMYQEEIISRQYKIKADEIRKIVLGCPVCVNGVPTEIQEVQVHRNLERIPSNRIRGGVGLVISEGIALKAMKIMKWSKQLGLDWSWLEGVIKVNKQSEKVTEIKPNPSYLDGLAAGRPLLSYPSRYGGFRLRYGKSRNTGVAAKAVNPAIMELLDEFIAVGTHIRIERPGKAAQLFPCNTIDGPIVLLQSGEVRQINTLEEAKEIKDRVKQLLFLGDILITIGDFRKTAHPLVPVGYVEEWWIKELEKEMQTKADIITAEQKEQLQENLNGMSFQDAVALSKKSKLPLHPKYIYYFTALDTDALLEIIQTFQDAKEKENSITIPYTERMKVLLENIGIPHCIEEGTICFKDAMKAIVLFYFGKQHTEAPRIAMEEVNVLDALSKITKVKIKDKAGTWIGVRMGRPEAAVERKMKGSPHSLFPIGLVGGPTRNIIKAVETEDKKQESQGVLTIEIAMFQCQSCKKTMPFPYCKECKERTLAMQVCALCSRVSNEEKCPACKKANKGFNTRKVNVKDALHQAMNHLQLRAVDKVKGVKALRSEHRIPEPLEKGLLRAKNNIYVFRDGTSRFELLNAVTTHFTPKEIGLTVNEAIALGYDVDKDSNKLAQENQLLELKPQDLIVNETAGDWLVKVATFIDDELEYFYKQPRYYNAKAKEDMIGQLVLGLAPHTSAAVVGRIIGYSKSRLGWQHPYYVMCKRRNIDGDQDSIMLMMDCLLNFSHTFLSEKSGGRMDAPLVFTVAVNPTEIDDEVYEMETTEHYPLSLYEKAQEYYMPYLGEIPRVEQKLGKESQFIDFYYTHATKQFDEGPTQSMYTQLQEMEAKIRKQAELQFRIKAVDGKDALERVLLSHFFKDLIGNTRSFSKQQFRCTKCMTTYRRIPLVGHCTKCKHKLIFTIAQGSVTKYLEIAKNMIHEYDLSDYLKQRIALTEQEIQSLFKEEPKQQKNLLEFV